MVKLIKMLEDIMVAVTFAEAGEFDEANRVANNDLSHEQKESTPVVVRG